MTANTLFDHSLTFEEVLELIKNGANVNDVNGYYETPLFYIDDLNIAKLLIKHGSNVNHRNIYNMTPIFCQDNIDICQLLINNGANINTRDINGLTILDGQDYVNNAKYLIKYGALPGVIVTYQKYHDFFSEEQQKAFDSFLLLTSDNDQFFQMCLAYQNDQKNNDKIEIKDMEII